MQIKALLPDTEYGRFKSFILYTGCCACVSFWSSSPINKLSNSKIFPGCRTSVNPRIKHEACTVVWGKPGTTQSFLSQKIVSQKRMEYDTCRDPWSPGYDAKWCPKSLRRLHYKRHNCKEGVKSLVNHIVKKRPEVPVLVLPTDSQAEGKVSALKVRKFQKEKEQDFFQRNL